ncbi:hypothetical protein OKA05_01715 [Luteolibacter arcticus]|uniref:Uncharacterized protein n=1 Tax=Luteolibacter arcticus TaxID=1581411 RepID=A0ABT3GE11_9BACT|nr:hypothetical protein [Luteolibacter arcticus]MCW1921249.1 hypothetical protein [Luteolibacter arcticus]
MLPQRRKSAEEIAKLRESLGISGETDPEAEPAAAENIVLPDTTPAPDPDTDAEVTESVAPAPERPERASLPAKPVRSLRKSERNPERSPLAPVETKNGIPLRRHEDRELMELRRIQAAPPDKAIAYIQQLAAPWPLVVLGYLFPLAGAACGLFAAFSPKIPEPDLQYQWVIDLSRAPWLDKGGFGALVACCAIGLLFAGWFMLKKPRSRHHGGFIIILAVLIAVFGIIHQFNPNGP